MPSPSTPSATARTAPDRAAKSPAASPSASDPAGAGARIAMLGGLAAAFGVASCCALPLLLATLGLGASSLSAIGLVAAPHRTLLMALAGVGLLGAAALLWRRRTAPSACAADGHRTTPWLTTTGIAAGVVLLVAGYLYA